jgi:hypothetical protein
MEPPQAFSGGGLSIQTHHLHVQGAQAQAPGSQAQESPQGFVEGVCGDAFFPFFSCCLRFDFMVIDS